MKLVSWNCPHCKVDEHASFVDKKGVICTSCNAHYEVSIDGTIRPIPYVTFARFDESGGGCCR